MENHQKATLKKQIADKVDYLECISKRHISYKNTLKEIKELREQLNNNKIMETVDLNSLSDKELKAELLRRKESKKEDRKAYKELVQQELPNAILLLQHVSQKLAEVKTEVFQQLIALVEMKQNLYGVKAKQQTHTFSLDNGDTITLGYRVTDGWDDTVVEGIAKINDFMASLATNEKTAKLVKAINNLLKKDAKGNLKANRVIELQNLASEFNSPLFSDGVEIIQQAYKPIKSVYFIDAATINDACEKVNIPLSISSVNFTRELKINI